MKISVVTPTFNSAATLADTLNSVVGQTYADVEHIIVDGASKDSTLQIVEDFRKAYQASGKTLRVVSEPDRGLYDAMNKGIALATGHVVGILNSDDFFSTPHILERVAREFASADVAAPAGAPDAAGHALDAVYGDVHYVDPLQTTRVVRYYSSASFRPWKMRMGFMPAHPSFYCRRQLYAIHGGFDLDFKVAADFEQLLRMILIGGISMRYIPMDFVTMRTGGASSSGLTSHKRIYRDHRRAYRKNGVYSNFILEGCRYLSKIVDLIKS